MHETNVITTENAAGTLLSHCDLIVYQGLCFAFPPASNETESLERFNDVTEAAEAAAAGAFD